MIDLIPAKTRPPSGCSDGTRVQKPVNRYTHGVITPCALTVHIVTVARGDDALTRAPRPIAEPLRMYRLRWS